jgi:hypothetical protein
MKSVCGNRRRGGQRRKDREGKVVCWKLERRLEWTRKYAIGKDSQRNKIYPVVFGEERDFLSLVVMVTESRG